jgi:hypothetical protein
MATTSYKPLARRLARLELDARARQTVWVASLSDDELDALCNRIPPDERAAYDAMTLDELERLADGRMPNAEWQRRLQDARTPANRNLNT